MPRAAAVLFLCGAATGARQGPETRLPDPPPTRREDFRETLHGVELIDPYRWLEDQEAPQTRAFIDAQNAYAHSLFDSLPNLGTIREIITDESL
jgi:protease II